ncbi:MAG: hypothetical protein H6571_05610 [Lewinellaceae bacterium]|nr:hypothetical protein [Lewinellaceae bacterium]
MSSVFNIIADFPFKPAPIIRGKFPTRDWVVHTKKPFPEFNMWLNFWRLIFSFMRQPLVLQLSTRPVKVLYFGQAFSKRLLMINHYHQHHQGK